MSNKNETRKQADLIFDRWQAELANRDRSHASLLDNFDLLFEDLMYAGTTFDVAEEYLQKAIVAHLPNKRIVKFMFKNSPNRGLTEQEYFEDWKRLIEDRAKQAFYFRFPLPEPKDKKEAGANAMSKEEYMKQRRYANSFPSLDLSKIPDLDTDEDDDVSFSMADLGE